MKRQMEKEEKVLKKKNVTQEELSGWIFENHRKNPVYPNN